ncbi:MAG: hypothetical protein K0R54_767 [Clostridiaceae bacterium]|jgi:hypothetical protein|nr:hypothetical protein [Clostridiaceae bacterium]
MKNSNFKNLKVTTIGKDDINKKQVLILSIIPVLLAYLGYITIIPLKGLMYIPERLIFNVVMCITLLIIHLIIHESIHAYLFNIYGNGKANIKFVYKDGALITFQSNREVIYSKNQITIILIAPYILVNLLFTILGIRFYSLNQISFIIVLLNSFGSSIDFYLCVKLWFQYGTVKYISIENLFEYKLYSSN